MREINTKQVGCNNCKQYLPKNYIKTIFGLFCDIRCVHRYNIKHSERYKELTEQEKEALADLTDLLDNK